MEKNVETYWGVHDPAIYRDDATGFYYIYCTGAKCYKSSDLIHWEDLGVVVEKPPKEAIEWTKSEAIWAPDIVKVGEEYRLYCSNSSWGVRQSCIFLAVSDSPEGPFEPRGIVVKTSEEMPCNAIDANIIRDQKTGEMYLLYGSFWGGVYLLKLEEETGLAASKDVQTLLPEMEESCGEVIGQSIARRPKWMSAAIEGPYMIYHPETDYYYLFVSYGSLKSDYNIRVARSRNVTGPFLDHNGVDLRNVEDSDNTTGYLLFSGYEWNDGTAYMGPGHNSVLRDADGQWYLLCHIREKNFRYEDVPSLLQVRKLFWTSDGWPLLSPEVYAGERTPTEETSAAGIEGSTVSDEALEQELMGIYERIHFQPMLPEGVHVATPMKLGKDHYYENASIQGTWEVQNQRLWIRYGDVVEEAIVTPIWDAQLQQETIGITGKSEDGFAFWAKRTAKL